MKPPFSDDGSLERVSVRVETTLPFSCSAIWAAIAAPDRWWARQARICLTEGGEYEVQLDRGWLRGRVVKAEPERLLSIVFRFATPLVSFETDFTAMLSRAGDGTQLSIEHTGPAIMAWMGERRAFEKTWRDVLVRLADYLRRTAKNSGGDAF